MKTKLHLIIMCLLLSIVGGGELYAWNYPTSKPSSPFSSGDGSSSKPYEIRDADDLAELAYMVREGGEDYSGKHFVMTNDITLNTGLVNADCTGRNTGDFKVWKPIGEYGFWSNKKFKGDFNGNSHTIYGLFIEAKDNFNGLFGVVNEGTIRNLTIADSYICASYPFYSSNYYGFIAGEATNATILNCHVRNSCIKNTDSDSRHNLAIGGLVGNCTKGDIIRKCSFNGNFILQSFDKSQLIEAGGISGSGTVKLYSCTAKGKFMVTGSPSIRVAGMTHEVEEAYGCVAGMDFDIQTYGDYYTGTLSDNAIVVAGFSHMTSGECTQCVTYGTIKVGDSDKPVQVQPLSEAPNYKRFRYNIRIGTFCSEEECTGFVAHNQCAAYTNVELYLHNDSKGNAYITSFGLSYSESRRSLLELKNCIVAGSHTIKSTTGICYNPVTLFDYRKTAVRDIEKAWEKVKGTRYCTYVNNKKDEDVYFDDVDFKDDNQKYVSISSDQLKGDALLNELNALSKGSNQWGRVATEGALNGYPMPVICGGIISDMKGSGTQEAPYLIGSEADLRNFQKKMETESSEGKYFKLTADIDMSEEPMPAIGPKANPFQGTFDGNGHSINGLVTGEGYLFHYLQGTVKNLTLLDYKGKADKTGTVTSIACFVGGSADGGVSKPGYIKNCYVSGNIEAYRSSIAYDNNVEATGLCLNIYEPSTVENCYFKGSIKVSSKTVDGHIVNSEFAGSSSPATTNLYVGGLAGAFGKATESTTPTAINSCYASFTYECDETGKAFDSKTVYGTIANTAAHQNVNYSYYVCDKEIDNYSEKLNSESELNDKLGGFSAWKKGYYRPVVEGTKYYTATLPDESRTVIYLDAIPATNPTHNVIMNVQIDAPYADKSVWQLPNVAVYVPSEQKDYITRGYLDQSSEFRYKRSEGATATLGQLHFALTQNDKGTHFFCLPGDVLKSDLPEGSDAMIGGKVNIVNDEEQVNVVHVDTIPAGVPCLLYVPVSSVQSGEEIDILMRSGIVSEPVLNADYSSFKGTFKPQAVSEDACMDVAKGIAARTTTRSAAQDDTYYFIRGNEGTQVKPFSSWLEGSLGNVRIVDYMLLDEYNNTNVELIESSTDDVNIKLRLTMTADKWTTICLPFDMSTDEIKEKFGEDTKLEEVESISYEGSTLNIKLKEATDGIVSGSPYFIKPSVSNSIFDLGPRILSNELAEVGNLAFCPDANQEIYLKMVGWFDISMLQSAEEFKAYYFNDGTLCELPKDYTMILGGFRCWFKASDSTASAPAELSSVIITHSDGTITDINVVASDPQSTKLPIYDLNGIEKKSEKGIYIKGGKVRIKN